ncbi:MAG: hypothetical protein ACLFRR_06775 [Spirochaetaceae bacterium]
MNRHGGLALGTFFLAVFLMVVPGSPVGAQEQEQEQETGEQRIVEPTAAQVERTTFLPQVFYVGDRVEMRVAFRTAAGASPRLPEESPTIPWGSLHGVRLGETAAGWELRVTFTPYRTGTQTLPAMRLGDVSLRSIDVPVSSILDEQRDSLAPLRDQLMLPGTRALIAGAAGLLVLIPGGWFLFFRWGRRKVRAVVQRYREALPYRRISRSLRQLAGDMNEMSDREFYIRLLSDFRAYLSKRMHADALSATTEELAAELQRYIPEAEDRQAVLDVFHFGDRVKFASRRASAEARTQHLEAVLRVLRHLERKRSRRTHAESQKGARRGI